MIVILYFGIPLAVISISAFRAEKGRRSVIMLTIMVALQVVFNMVSILNSLDKKDSGLFNVGISMTFAQIVTYFAVLYITCKRANKVKHNLSVGYTYRLQDMRIKHMMTPKQVAEIIGIKKQQYSRYELGKEDIPVDVIFQLAKLYGVSTDYLLGKTNEEQNTSNDELKVQKTSPGSEQKN